LLCIIIAIIPKEAETIEIIKEVEKEVIVEIEKEPTYIYNVTSMERELLARLVYREANIESLECQMAVASTVINRWQDGRWGETLEEVIYSPYQFTPANLLYKTTPTELNYTAVDLVLQNGCTLPPYVMYFRANHHFAWDGYKPYTQIDYTCFGYFVADKNS
jgi:spore germination cell wall hydrolase CwlJ-like protein